MRRGTQRTNGIVQLFTGAEEWDVLAPPSEADHCPQVVGWTPGYGGRHSGKRIVPSFEEGRLRHTSKCHATSTWRSRGGQTGEDDSPPSAHPGRAENKVALHLFDR